MTTSSRISIGGVPPNVRVSLRVFGPDLEPTRLTDALGIEPSLSYRRGAPVSARHIDAKRRQGMWLLESSSSPDSPLEQHITSLLERLSDTSSWLDHTQPFERDLFCGVFLTHQNSGLSLPPAVIKDIARLGLELNFDLYVETDDEPPDGPI